MDLWYEAEIRTRRDEALKAAHLSRLSRLAVSGRSPGVRTRLAYGVQVASDALAALARTLRAGETA